jgi:hypothetical protein
LKKDLGQKSQKRWGGSIQHTYSSSARREKKQKIEQSKRRNKEKSERMFLLHAATHIFELGESMNIRQFSAYLMTIEF